MFSEGRCLGKENGHNISRIIEIMRCLNAKDNKYVLFLSNLLDPKSREASRHHARGTESVA